MHTILDGDDPKIKLFASTIRRIFMLDIFSFMVILIMFYVMSKSSANTCLSELVIIFTAKLLFGLSLYLFGSSQRELSNGDIYLLMILLILFLSVNNVDHFASVVKSSRNLLETIFLLYLILILK